MTKKKLDFSRLKEEHQVESASREIKESSQLDFSREKSRELMKKLSQYRMPFGKYKNYLLVDLPEPYVIWFSQKGFPSGELGQMLGIVYEIKANGLEYLFKKKS